jgi:hypothetical protein
MTHLHAIARNAAGMVAGPISPSASGQMTSRASDDDERSLPPTVVMGITQ